VKHYLVKASTKTYSSKSDAARKNEEMKTTKVVT